MPAKPQADKGPQLGPGKIKVKVDVVSANRGVKEITKMFDRIRDRLIKMFIEYLESPEGQEAIKKAIREELKK